MREVLQLFLNYLNIHGFYNSIKLVMLGLEKTMGEFFYGKMNGYTVKRLQKIILFDRLGVYDYDMID